VSVVTQSIVRITDHSPRCDIEAAITVLRERQDRMPAHWLDRRADVGDEIDVLVDRWLTVVS
jgi:hypothetical protein